ncbi:MAG: PD-(D/E)XK nuclease family protein, partial [Acidobacteriia bacterium]|nr:PD-(D/E)XK nuclease family protein [Terriglobia bacterium]
VVRDLLALTRAMLHLADRASWLAILRAPWCGLDLHDLHALVQGEADAVIRDQLSGDLSALSEAGAGRARRVREILARAFAERGRMRLRRWIERTWWALGGPACVAEDALQDAADYFNLLDEHERAGDLPDFDGFRTQVEGLYAKPDAGADGALQLMTIHKAKGLQFDTVIVPGLGRPPRPDSAALLLSAERPRPEGVDRLLAAIRETGQDQDPVYRYLRELEKAKSGNESIRLLYVACTRARRRLHLMGHAVQNAAGETAPEPGSLLGTLWDGLRAEDRELFEARYAGPAEEQRENAAPAISLRRLSSDWAAPDLPAALPLRPAPAERGEAPRYFWVGDTLRHIGAVVHAALERIGKEGAEHWDEARVRGGRALYQVALANLGTPPRELEGAGLRVEEALIRTLNSVRGRWILAARPEARCEYAVAGVVDGEIVHAAVDRTFVDADGTRWIVDYKTSDHQGGGLDGFLDEEQRRYRGQLERYARLLGGRVRLGLYFPLLDGWREWEARPPLP